MVLNLKNTVNLIEYLTNELSLLINNNGNKIDSEVMRVSKILDSTLSHYNYIAKLDISNSIN